MTDAGAAGYVPLNERPHGGHAKLLALVDEGKRVLDIGCSSGYLARPLVQRGCTVVGIEQDPIAAEQGKYFEQSRADGAPRHCNARRVNECRGLQAGLLCSGAQ